MSVWIQGSMAQPAYFSFWSPGLLRRLSPSRLWSSADSHPIQRHVRFWATDRTKSRQRVARNQMAGSPANLPRSGDRTSLRQSSPQKREFSPCGLETFARFSRRLSVSGLLETGAICENPRKMQGFRTKIDHYLRSSDWLADVEGIELPHSRL